jgi:hypothetical protein
MAMHIKVTSTLCLCEHASKHKFRFCGHQQGTADCVLWCCCLLLQLEGMLTFSERKVKDQLAAMEKLQVRQASHPSVPCSCVAAQHRKLQPMRDRNSSTEQHMCKARRTITAQVLACTPTQPAEEPGCCSVTP